MEKWFRARAVSSKNHESRTERGKSDDKEDKCLHVTVTPAAL